MSPRTGTAIAAALVAALLATPPLASAKRKPPSCYRGGATLVAADGNARVVRVKHKPPKGATSNDFLLSCWAPTGRRGKILTEREFGDDLRVQTQIEIVDGRWVGAYIDFLGGVTESTKALVYDARNHRTVHDSRACDVERGDFTGVDDVAFLPSGGMAFACSRLLMFKDAGSATTQDLEPVGTFVLNLAVAHQHRGFGPRLYWTVEVGQTQTVKSLPL